MSKSSIAEWLVGEKQKRESLPLGVFRNFIIWEVSWRYPHLHTWQHWIYQPGTLFLISSVSLQHHKIKFYNINWICLNSLSQKICCTGKMLMFSLQVYSQNPSLLVTKSVGVFPHIHRFSNISWASYNLTEFWHYLPRDSVKSHRLRTQFHTICLPLQMPIASTGCHLCFCPTIYKLDVPRTLLWVQ